jgi:L-threonate 2-dehydrogenase
MSGAQARVGLLGLGIMGGAYAHHLLRGGFEVVGYDPSKGAAAAFAERGGRPLDGPAAVAESAEILLLALPSEAALRETAAACAPALRPGAVVAEMSTLPLSAKDEARAVVEAAGAVMLDCPVSGTGAQAAVGDLVVFVSGDEAGADRLAPVFAAIARDVRRVGPFGAGMKLKCVANLLVSIHNLAAAEALLLAEKSGLDLRMTLDAVAGGAGGSRMLDLRGPLMVEGRYQPATMKMDVYIKDVMLILEQARACGCPTPLMAATLPYYLAALAQGRDKEDTAALFEVLRQMAEPKGGTAWE